MGFIDEIRIRRANSQNGAVRQRASWAEDEEKKNPAWQEQRAKEVLAGIEKTIGNAADANKESCRIMTMDIWPCGTNIAVEIDKLKEEFAEKGFQETLAGAALIVAKQLCAEGFTVGIEISKDWRNYWLTASWKEADS